MSRLSSYGPSTLIMSAAAAAFTIALLIGCAGGKGFRIYEAERNRYNLNLEKRYYSSWIPLDECKFNLEYVLVKRENPRWRINVSYRGKEWFRFEKLVVEIDGELFTYYPGADRRRAAQAVDSGKNVVEKAGFSVGEDFFRRAKDAKTVSLIVSGGDKSAAARLTPAQIGHLEEFYSFIKEEEAR